MEEEEEEEEDDDDDDDDEGRRKRVGRTKRGMKKRREKERNVCASTYILVDSAIAWLCGRLFSSSSLSLCDTATSALKLHISQSKSFPKHLVHI